MCSANLRWRKKYQTKCVFFFQVKQSMVKKKQWLLFWPELETFPWLPYSTHMSYCRNWNILWIIFRKNVYLWLRCQLILGYKNAYSFKCQIIVRNNINWVKTVALTISEVHFVRKDQYIMFIFKVAVGVTAVIFFIHWTFNITDD